MEIGLRMSLQSNSPRAGWSEDQTLVATEFPTPVQTSPGARPGPCAMGTRSLFRG